MSLLYQQIGKPASLLHPQTLTSDPIALDSNSATVSVGGMRSVLFLLDVGAAATMGSFVVSLNYSSSGQGSDLGTSTTVWAASDAAFASVDSDGVSTLYMLEVDLLAKGLNGANGIMGASVAVTATSDGAPPVSLVAIPYPATFTMPYVGSTDVTVANASA